MPKRKIEPDDNAEFFLGVDDTNQEEPDLDVEIEEYDETPPVAKQVAPTRLTSDPSRVTSSTPEKVIESVYGTEVKEVVTRHGEGLVVRKRVR